MKFTCNQLELTRTLNIVSKAISSRTTIPTLKGINIDIKSGIATFTASDMDITIENSIEVANSEDGSIVVPAKLFGDIVRKLPNNDIEFNCEDEKITIKCLTSEFSLVGMPSDEFPNIKNTEEDAKKLTFDKLKFADMIRKTSFAASIDQTKGVITGILLEIANDNIKMVAIDGYRMAITSEEMANKENHRIIISAKIMNEISKIISETNLNSDSKDINILVDNKSAVLMIDNIKVIMRLIAGEFINYQDIIPKTASINVKLRKSELMECVERASLLSKEGKNNLIKLSIKDNVITITSRSEEGNVKEDLLAEKTGEDLDIGFNAKYIIDILKVISDEEIIMKFNTSISPCLITPVEGESYEYLVLPVRLSNM